MPRRLLAPRARLLALLLMAMGCLVGLLVNAAAQRGGELQLPAISSSPSRGAASSDAHTASLRTPTALPSSRELHYAMDVSTATPKTAATISMGPTEYPTTAPSLQSHKPSRRPTRRPTRYPTEIPTATPRPTASPTVASAAPTARPSLAATRRPSVAPSAVPTPAPSRQTEPLVVLMTYYRLTNVHSAALPESDSTAVITTQALLLNVSISSVLFVGSEVALDSVGETVSIVATTRMVLNLVDYSQRFGWDGLALFSAFTAVLSDAVESGVFLDVLLSVAQDLDAVGLFNASAEAVSFAAPRFSFPPTWSPTLKPMPMVGSLTPALIGVLVVAVVVAVPVLVFSVALLAMRCKKQRGRVMVVDHDEWLSDLLDVAKPHAARRLEPLGIP